MNILLNICKEYTSIHKLLYNGSKSFALCFKKNTSQFSIILSRSNENSDVDLKRQMRKLYANVNLLLIKFSKCSVGVKCFLFKTYCSNLYYAPMWFDCTKAALKKLKMHTTACDYLCSCHGVIVPPRCL